MSRATARTGRPPKPPSPGTRVSLGLKVTPAIKNRLDESARVNGRTQSQEAELRLERSFELESHLTEALTSAYGRETAGILTALGILFSAVGTSAAHERAIRSGEPVQPWPSDAYALDQAVRTAIDFLNRIVAPIILQDGAIRVEVTEARPVLYAGEMARELRGIPTSSWSEGIFGKDNIAKIRDLIGDLTNRLDTSGIAMESYGSSTGGKNGNGS